MQEEIEVYERIFKNINFNDVKVYINNKQINKEGDYMKRKTDIDSFIETILCELKESGVSYVYYKEHADTIKNILNNVIITEKNGCYMLVLPKERRKRK